MAYGIGAKNTDVSIADIAELTDVFYIGGTKVGAMFGEAVVITNLMYKNNFRSVIKQHGGMLAKGRFLGIQFDVLMEEEKYLELGEQADVLAVRIRKAFEKRGIQMYYDSYTNQQFPVLSKAWIKILQKEYVFCIWKKLNQEYSVVRFCTSWATQKENVDKLVKLIEEAKVEGTKDEELGERR